MAIRRLFRRPDGKWAWQLVVEESIVATAGDQGYENEDDARDMADRIISGEFAAAEKRVRRGSTPKHAPARSATARRASGAGSAPKLAPKRAAKATKAHRGKGSAKQPAVKRTPANTSSTATKKTAQKPGTRASTSGQHQAKRGGGEATVPKGHRLPPARRKDEQWLNVDPTKNRRGRQTAAKKQTSAKKVSARASTSPRGGKTPSKGASASITSAELRAWARSNGYAVGDRGRVPAHISAAYRDAHQR
jgi:hypothetical protein